MAAEFTVSLWVGRDEEYWLVKGQRVCAHFVQRAMLPFAQRPHPHSLGANDQAHIHLVHFIIDLVHLA